MRIRWNHFYLIQNLLSFRCHKKYWLEASHQSILYSLNIFCIIYPWQNISDILWIEHISVFLLRSSAIFVLLDCSFSISDTIALLVYQCICFESINFCSDISFTSGLVSHVVIFQKQFLVHWYELWQGIQETRFKNKTFIICWREISFNTIGTFVHSLSSYLLTIFLRMSFSLRFISGERVVSQNSSKYLTTSFSFLNTSPIIISTDFSYCLLKYSWKCGAASILTISTSDMSMLFFCVRVQPGGLEM